MSESRGREIHAKSLRLREDKKFLESLQLDYEALREYALEKDSLSFAEILSMHAKTLIHEYKNTKFRAYLIMAKHLAMAAVDIANESGDISQTVLPNFTLGEVASEEGDLVTAEVAYERAVKRLETHPPERHNRKSVLANFKIHLTTTQYKKGDKSALDKAELALKDLEKSKDANPYEYAVWLSGAHMRIAEMLKEDDPKKAKEHLNMAKEIIDKNPDLVIRRDQWNELAKTF